MILRALSHLLPGRLAPFVLAMLPLSLMACGGTGEESVAPGAPDLPHGEIRIEPSSTALAPGEAAAFTALSDTATAVTWEIAEAPAGGSVDPNGLYTAPNAEGTYHLVVRSVDDPTRTAQATIMVQGSDWVDVTAYGARGDGTTDDTAAFNAAAATGMKVRVPKPSAFYRITGTVRLRASIQGDGSMPEIRMFGANGTERYSMLAVVDYTGPGLTISGLRLNGQWDGVSANGEWSHNVLVKGSSNVTIEDNLLERAYGDNILLGGEGNPRPSRNVIVRNNQLIGPRRCNVALISVRGVSITGNTIRKANEYVSAIDLEPNANPNESDWDVQITGNDFQVPRSKAVLLYHFDYGYPPDGLAGGDITITGNTGSAMRFFSQTGNWVRVTQSGNF